MTPELSSVHGEEARYAPGVLSWMREHGDEMRKLLSEWARIESPSRVPEAQAPLMAALAREFEALGFRTRHFAGRRSGGCLYALPRDRARGREFQLVLGHCDTVWPESTLAEMPVRVDGKRLRGPGVYDMKAGDWSSWCSRCVGSTPSARSPRWCPSFWSTATRRSGAENRPP